MNESAAFLLGAGCMVILAIVFSPKYGEKIEQTCQGKSWVIEEPLIKKTLTCVVEIKEKK